MRLNEIVENNTIEQISQRTRLTKDTLEKLFARDFKGMMKVQTLGFISILEREYRADLDELRKDCLLYFGEVPEKSVHKDANAIYKNTQSPSLIPDANVYKPNKKYIKYTVLGVFAAGLLYAAWHTYTSGKQTNKTTIAQKQNGGFFASIVGQTKTWFGNDTQGGKTSNKGVSGDEKGWSKEKNKTKPTMLIVNKIERKTSSTEQDVARKIAKEENEIIKKVKAEQTKIQHSKNNIAENIGEVQKINNAIASAGDGTRGDEPLAAEVPSISDRTVAKSTTDEASAAKKAEREKSKKAARKKSEDNQKKARELVRQEAAKKIAQKKMAKAKAARLKAEKARAAKLKDQQLKAAKIKAAAQAKAAKLKASQAKAAKARADRAKTAKALKSAQYVIKPAKSIWFGIVDLRTMHRRTYTGTGAIAFDKPNGRWIVTASHGHFSFRAGSRVVKFNDNNKHYLIIQKGNIHEITHATFQKLNQNKAW
jgi:hypothetical protein